MKAILKTFKKCKCVWGRFLWVQSWIIAFCNTTSCLWKNMCTHIYTHRCTLNAHKHTVYTHSFMHLFSHTHNNMCWLLFSQPVCLVWWQTKNNISLFPVVTATIWVWRAGGVVSLWFIENLGRPTELYLTANSWIPLAGRSVCVCFSYQCPGDVCCIPV